MLNSLLEKKKELFFLCLLLFMFYFFNIEHILVCNMETIQMKIYFAKKKSQI